jgi:hypothetical protein
LDIESYFPQLISMPPNQHRHESFSPPEIKHTVILVVCFVMDMSRIAEGKRTQSGWLEKN